MLNYSTQNSRDRLKQYQMKDILDATPQQLLIKIYDFAILNCNKKNLAKTNAALQELINTLRFDDQCKEISTGFYRLYLYCQEEMRKKNYPIVLKILTELRESWINAFNSL